MSAYLTDAELAAVQHLHRSSPYTITGISYGIFSIARHYGGMKCQGDNYVYMPESDECVRTDVVRAVEKMRRADRKKAAPQPEQHRLGI
jgi:hypothetical protein